MTKHMKTVTTLISWHLFLLFAMGNATDGFCQTTEPVVPKKTSAEKIRFMSEESLAKLVNTNMTRQQITQKFGKPDIDRIPTGGIDVWDFVFYPDDRDTGPRRFIASGLTVYWKGDKMIRWAPAYGTTGGKPPSEFMKTITPGGVKSGATQTNQDFSFWVVSASKIEGGRYIDTAKLEKLGWIGKEPALRVARLKSASSGHEPVNYDGKSPREEYRFDIDLLPEDAASFENLTRQNRGKQVLMMLGDQPLTAPRVNGPISGGQFVITVHDEKSYEELRVAFTRLVEGK